MRFIFSIVFTCFSFLIASAQAVGYLDAGQAYLRLYLESNDNVYTRVNNYKVAGTPYLFGNSNNANVYSKKEGGDGFSLGYNTYSQNVEIASAGKGNFIEKTPSDIDSFLLIKSESSPYENDILFKSSQIFGEKKPYFLQQVYRGLKYSLYKAYRSELAIVSTNYAQSDLRQFDLKFDYYYTENSFNKLTRLKINKKSILSEFKNAKDFSNLLYSENFEINNEKNLVTIFKNYIN